MKIVNIEAWSRWVEGDSCPGQNSEPLGLALRSLYVEHVVVPAVPVEPRWLRRLPVCQKKGAQATGLQVKNKNGNKYLPKERKLCVFPWWFEDCTVPSSKCEREFCSLHAVEPKGMKKDGDCKDVTKAVKHLWGFPENTQREMSGHYNGVWVLFSLTTDVQILISGIKLLSSWEHPVQNSWRSCSRRYGTTLRTDPSTLASLFPNFFQTLSSQPTQNTTNSKVCLTTGCGSRANSYGAMLFPVFILSSCTPF